MKRTQTIYAQAHIHDAVKRLADWQREANPKHTLSEEYDRILRAGMYALYDVDVPLKPKSAEPQTPPPNVGG